MKTSETLGRAHAQVVNNGSTQTSRALKSVNASRSSAFGPCSQRKRAGLLTACWELCSTDADGLSNSLGNQTSHLRPLHSPTQLFVIAYRMSQAIPSQTASSRTPEAVALPADVKRWDVPSMTMMRTMPMRAIGC